VRRTQRRSSLPIMWNAFRNKVDDPGCTGRHRSSLLTGLYAMATAEHREPCDSRGSCTVLGAPGGETPSGDSSRAADVTRPAWTDQVRTCRYDSNLGDTGGARPGPRWRSCDCLRVVVHLATP
jgi:hypothetical protein